jgi:hypothetical protein
MRLYPTFRIGLAICLFLSLKVPAQVVPTQHSDGLSEPEYEVFSAYLNQSFTGAVGVDRVGDPVGQIVIVNSTEADKDDLENDEVPPGAVEKYLRTEARCLHVATIRNFHQANMKQVQLALRFHLSIQYQLVSAARIGSILKDVSSWPKYYKQYPGAQGYVALSRVGFSADGKQALFYASNWCGGKCGTGSYVVMEKHGSVWKIRKEVFMWMS